VRRVKSKNLGGRTVNSISVLNEQGVGSIRLGTINGTGLIPAFNKHGVHTGYLGTDKNNDGLAMRNNRYRDTGWSASGKK